MPRKGRFGYDLSNTSSDGHYIVGKGRPPESGKFRKGDGRKRGRRLKGTKNLAIDLREELDSSVTVTVGGVPKKVSRQRAIVMRLTDNATKGQNSAIALALELQQRVLGPLLQREEQERHQEEKQDYSRLTDVELKVLVFLMGKLEGTEDEGCDVISVSAIYKEGHHVSAIEREG